MGLCIYSLYAMWTPALVGWWAKTLGVAGSGIIGGIIALVINGYTQISVYIQDAIYLQGDYGSYTFVIGFCAFCVVLVYTGITTSGRSLVV
jgi:phosphotransferase system  glucose/maltose/N-acetylglucosamine-specific IIC component